MKRRRPKARLEPLDASLIASLSENTARAYEATGRIGREKAVLGSALAMLVFWLERDPEDAVFQAMRAEVAKRRITAVQYEHELIEAARTALKQGGYL